MENAIKVIVAEDHQIVLDGLISILSSVDEIEVIAIAKNGNQVLETLKSEHADIALLDLNMPEMNGVETTEQIQSTFPKTKVLILTMHDNLHYVKNLYKLGISGYLLKDAPKTELIQAIKAIHAGATYFDQQVMASALSQISEPAIKLTRRETEVLELLNQGLSTKELSEKLFISINTVETHRKHLLEKLNVNSTPKLLTKAREIGLL